MAEWANDTNRGENEMKTSKRCWQSVLAIGGLATVVGVILGVIAIVTRPSEASGLKLRHRGHGCADSNCGPQMLGELGGTWYWVRSPAEEKRVIMGLYNRYCIRCHGVDGRGVWDIPGIPNFTDPRWQAHRTDAQIARIIIEGRGAVMPPFRRTLSPEEAWAMARYLRTFVPGTEAPRPDRLPSETIKTPPTPVSPPIPQPPAK